MSSPNAAVDYLAAAHGLMVRYEAQKRVGVVTSQQSIETATWIIAHALLGLLTDRVERQQ